MNTWNATINKYLQHMQAAGRAKTTIRLHYYYLANLRKIAPAPARVSPERIEHYFANQVWAPETRRSARAVARCFFGYLLEQEIIKVDPTKCLPPVHVPQGTPRPAPDILISAAIRQADSRTSLMIRLAAYCGLRASEIAKVHGCDWDGQYLTVVGKGGRRRLVPSRAEACPSPRRPYAT